jgi:general secretion pathway protein C
MMLALLALALAAPPPADLAAVGVVLARRPEASVAVLRSGGRSRVVGVGESAFGGHVTSIEGGRVVIDFDGTRTELRLVAGAAPPLAAAAPPAATAPADALSMERREVEQRLALETSRILAETSLVPVQDGAQVSGFAITRMPEGTLLSDAGLRPGDIVTEVNGVAIDSLATLVGLWPRLQNETTLRAVVLRGGQPVTLTVSLR